MLKVEKLYKYYGKLCAAENICFDIYPGEVCILLGPNGAGKTTTIKCIAGLLRFKGIVSIDNHSSGTIQAKRLFGYIPETPALYDLLTIEEHIHFIAKAYGLSGYENNMEELLEIFDLSDKRKKTGKELSKGMQQKLSICCALIYEPKLLMLDEPLVGLDPKAIKELKSLVLELRQKGCAFLISTHIIDSIVDLWDRVLIMKNSKIIDNIRRDELYERNLSLENYFFQMTEVAQ